MGSIIQVQWSIDNTIFKSAEVLLHLLRASRDDDVQSAAAMSMDALGSAMIICPQRISDGQAALSGQGPYEQLLDAFVALGLKPGGIAYFIRSKATRSIPAFVLASALKTFLSDEEIGNVLYEMLVCQGLSRKPELNCSRDQLTEVIASLSAYSDRIIPNHAVEAVIKAIRTSTNPSAAWMKEALRPPGPETFAKVQSPWTWAVIPRWKVAMTSPSCVMQERMMQSWKMKVS